jgi:hypothetical protein
MHRLIVVFLAAFDAAIAVAVGIAATLAPLTLLWVFGLGDRADWGALWPASSAVWQLGHLAPLAITLPGEYLAATGIDASVASFTLSLAPLAFATFTAIFAARSGARASRADAWVTGVGTGTVVVAVLAALIAVSSRNSVAAPEVWQAVVFPTAVFGVSAMAGAVATEWREAGAGFIARARDRVEAQSGGWGAVIGVSTRASAVAVVGLIGVGALVLFVAITLNAGDIVALYQAGNLDLVGVMVMTLAQFAYLPTLVVWGLSFAAGPGFGLGAGTAVSPSGTQLGIVPGVPILGAIPESTTTWLLLLALLPVGVGVLAGWVARSRLLAAAGFVPTPRPRRSKRAKTPKAPKTGKTPKTGKVPKTRTDAAPAAAADSVDLVTTPPDYLTTTTPPAADAARRAALEGLLAAQPATAAPERPVPALEEESDALPDAVPDEVNPADHAETSPGHPRPIEPILPRLVVIVAIAGLAAGAAALLAVFASGSFGPGQLAHVGPEPGPVALAVGLEVLLGAGILLLSSRRGADGGDRHRPTAASSPAAGVEDAGTDDAAEDMIPLFAPLFSAGPIAQSAPTITPSPAPAYAEPDAVPASPSVAVPAAPAYAEPDVVASPSVAEPDAVTEPIDLPTLPDEPQDGRR